MLLGKIRPGQETAMGQRANMEVMAAASGMVAVRVQRALMMTQRTAYSHQKAVFGGFHSSGALLPLARLAARLTAMRCSQLLRSLAYDCRRAVVHA